MNTLRRNLCLGIGLVTGAALLAERAFGDQIVDAALEDQFRDFESSDVPEFRVLGTSPATSDETALAQQILDKAPKTSPLQVFQYLLADTHKNVDGEAYNGGWKVRWNPVIVAFFNAVHGRPEGDVTPWCAASLNWAMMHCGLKGTGSASTSSFRNAPGKTDNPVVGDIVVFQRTDPAEAKAGHGHVGLYLDSNDDDDTIYVLGGNQINSKGHHIVSAKWIPKASKFLTLNSYHSMKALT